MIKKIIIKYVLIFRKYEENMNNNFQKIPTTNPKLSPKDFKKNSFFLALDTILMWTAYIIFHHQTRNIIWARKYRGMRKK